MFGGSGLGLFVSRKLCDLMGGNIDVDSVYGQGATFRFYISATVVGATLDQGDGQNKTPSSRRPSPPSSHLESALLPSSGSSNPLAPSASLTARHILITEDNLINQTVLNRQLKQAGFTTELASNGQQAIDRIKSLASSNRSQESSPRRFDVILVS